MIEVVRPVTAGTVLEILAEGRDLFTGSGPWTTRFIARADAQFGGRWREVELTGLDVIQLWLPPHSGEPCQGDRGQLVPSGGKSVDGVVRQLQADRRTYEEASPCCWGRISTAMHQPFSTIIATTQPLDEPDYRTVVRTSHSRLYHLDGLHRLIGWGLASRLTPDTRLRVLVAG